MFRRLPSPCSCSFLSLASLLTKSNRPTKLGGIWNYLTLGYMPPLPFSAPSFPPFGPQSQDQHPPLLVFALRRPAIVSQTLPKKRFESAFFPMLQLFLLTLFPIPPNEVGNFLSVLPSH